MSFIISPLSLFLLLPLLLLISILFFFSFFSNHGIKFEIPPSIANAGWERHVANRNVFLSLALLNRCTLASSFLAQAGLNWNLPVGV